MFQKLILFSNTNLLFQYICKYSIVSIKLTYLLLKLITYDKIIKDIFLKYQRSKTLIFDVQSFFLFL